MDSSDLDRLFTRAADGDRTAVEPAFEQLWPIVQRYCLKLTRSPTDAEDATQTSLTKMFEQAAQYDRRRPAVGWALSFAYWECRTINTRRTRQKTREAPLPEDSTPIADALAPSIEETLQDEEARLIAVDLINALPEEDQKLLIGRQEDLENLLRELSPAARRKRKQRLVNRLQKAFTDVFHPRGKP